MKNNQPHIDRDYYDYIGEQDGKAHRKSKSNLIRGIASAFTLSMFLLGALYGGYRAYMALFPPR